jgi:hypothetical protein
MFLKLTGYLFKRKQVEEYILCKVTYITFIYKNLCYGYFESDKKTIYTNQAHV